jgi:protein PhnA
MVGDNDEYVYDEATGEWRPPQEAATSASIDQVEVRDAAGNVLVDGDSVSPDYAAAPVVADSE